MCAAVRAGHGGRLPSRKELCLLQARVPAAICTGLSLQSSSALPTLHPHPAPPTRTPTPARTTSTERPSRVEPMGSPSRRAATLAAISL